MKNLLYTLGWPFLFGVLVGYVIAYVEIIGL